MEFGGQGRAAGLRGARAKPLGEVHAVARVAALYPPAAQDEHERRGDVHPHKATRVDDFCRHASQQAHEHKGHGQRQMHARHGADDGEQKRQPQPPRARAGVELVVKKAHGD